MVSTQPYLEIVPFPRDERTAAEMAGRGFEFGGWPVDYEAFRWYMAESFHKAARNHALELIEFDDVGEIDPDTLAPEKLGELLKRMDQPAEDLIFRKYTGLARRTIATDNAVAADLDARRDAVHTEIAAMPDAQPPQPLEGDNA